LGLSLRDADSIQEKLLAKVDDVAFILELVAGYHKEVFGLTADLSSLTYEQVEALPVDDLIQVITKVVEVNKDFFMVRVLPLIRGALAR
jgi:hypothetical protein